MKQTKTAYFAGGCFWCITPTFKEMPGVTSVVSGYSGGEEIDPTYEDVKYQRTSHRETIKIDYDPAQVSFEQLIEVFLSSVDPYDPDGQFIDRGFSYTLAVYYLTEAQKTATETALQNLAREAGRTPFIALEEFKNFYMAEEYHQDYDLKNPEAFRKELIESGRMQE
jgi:peptide-methionine (S)-S-oxide reductase